VTITVLTGDAAPTLRRLGRYLVAATLARTADAGAGVGLLLLCLARADRVDHPVVTGGLLTAALSAPHLVGPVLARRLDLAADGRRVLALACGGYAGGLAAAALLLGRAPLVVVALLVAGAGACGPLLTGGLSSRLGPVLDPVLDPGRLDQGRPAAPGPVAGPGRGSGPAPEQGPGPEPSPTVRGLRRRAEGFDVTTYGVAASLGPAAVATLATATSPLVALLALSGAALIAAGLTLTLPATRRIADGVEALRTREVLRLLATHGPLRRVVVATMVAAVSLGGLAVAAVVLAGRLQLGPSAGGVLAATYGVGNLVGSLLVTVVPGRTEPEVATTRWILVVAAGLLVGAAAPPYPVALVGFALAGIGTSPYVAATLRARSAYAPPAARAQVFVTVSAAKTAAGSAGAAVAGVVSAQSPRLLLLAAAAAIVLTSAGLGLERRRGARRA
jgi:hypothetical protein